MKDYRETMRDLSFTQEQKEAMVESLLAESQTAPHRFPRRRALFIAIAAALALTVTAGASGLLRSAGEVFAAFFGDAPAQTALIDDIGHPIGISSQSADGITITADAILGDAYHYSIIYTIQRDDGKPIIEEMQTLDASLLPFSFESGGVFGYGGHFFDENPSDPSIQFLESVSSDTPFEHSTVTATFKNLSTHTEDSSILIAEGPWEITFDFSYQNTSIQFPLSPDQTVQVSGMVASLDSVVLSPLSLTVDYSFDHVIQWGADQNTEVPDNFDELQSKKYLALPISITLQNGTILEPLYPDSRISTGKSNSECQLFWSFDEILPLDTIQSITIGDLTIPVEAP